MNPTPEGWPRMVPCLVYEDAPTAIAWLCAAFDFDARLVIESADGRISHAELQCGEGLVVISSPGPEPHTASPLQLGGCRSHSLMVFVDDVDEHCARARAAGATIAREPKNDDYGHDYWTDRNYEAVDCEGHHWWFVQRLATASGPARRGVIREPAFPFREKRRE